MLIALYRFLTFCLQPFLPWFLKRRVRLGKEDVLRLNERYGIANVARPAGDLIWVHAASVGELLAILPLLERISQPLLVTTMTKTSAELALKNGLHHQYLPFDTPQNVTRFLDHWQPTKAIFIEQELWINLILGCKARHIPLYLVNARFSSRSLRQWSRFPKTKARVFGAFQTIFSQDFLGLDNECVVGNLKFDVPYLKHSVKKLDCFTWIAASTHKGEEEIAIKAHNYGLLILAPRHPERRDEIIKLLPEIKCRSKGEYPTSQDKYFLLDTIGEMPYFYALCDVAFMGKSLKGEGGQNPIEAIIAGCVVLHGANVSNFQSLYDELDANDAALLVRNSDDIVKILTANHEERRIRAKLIIEKYKGALNKIYQGIFS